MGINSILSQIFFIFCFLTLFCNNCSSDCCWCGDYNLQSNVSFCWNCIYSIGAVRDCMPEQNTESVIPPCPFCGHPPKVIHDIFNKGRVECTNIDCPLWQTIPLDWWMKLRSSSSMDRANDF